MRSVLFTALVIILFACQNSKAPEKRKEDTSTVTNEEKLPASSIGHVTAVVDGKDIQFNGSLLVSKDKDHLQPGADQLVIMTSSGGENSSSLTINFLMAFKPGTYPIVGRSFTRGSNENGEIYGSILGGKPTLTDQMVTLTEVKDLGPNGLGGHKWMISGFAEAMTIDAMKMMLMDESKHHPKQVKIDKVSFTNLPFDDNWEEIMNKAMEKLKKAN